MALWPVAPYRKTGRIAPSHHFTLSIVTEGGNRLEARDPPALTNGRCGSVGAREDGRRPANSGHRLPQIQNPPSRLAYRTSLPIASAQAVATSRFGSAAPPGIVAQPAFCTYSPRSQLSVFFSSARLDDGFALF